MAEGTTSSPRIAIEASSVVGLRTGIGHYTAELLSALGQGWPAVWSPACVWVNSRRHRPPAADPWHSMPAFQVRHTRWPGKLLLRLWQGAGWPPCERFTGPVDLLHSPASYIIPVRAARRVLTVHDLYFKHAPEHVETYGGRYFLKTFERNLARMDHIIAVSNFTRDELLRFYPIAPERISVVPHGVDPRRFSAEPRPEDPQTLRALGLEQPYILCVATIEPRKNLITLIEAYARTRQILRAGGQRLPNLVITGQPGWGIEALEQRVQEARLHDVVKLTGYVDDQLLAPLYRQALGFIFPSVYEGFGIPVLEAMACGCPVMAAQAGALPEVAGEAAVYFNPRDSDNMARVLTRFITDPHLREHLREAGHEQVRQFAWSATAQATLDVYRRVLELPPSAVWPD